MADLPVTAPVWPRGVYAYALLCLLAVASTVAFFPHLEVVQSGWLKPVHEFSLDLFLDQETVVRVVQFGFLIHLFESIYASYLCGRNKLPKTHAAGWCALTMLFGFPALEILMKICNQIARVKSADTAEGDASQVASSSSKVSSHARQSSKKKQ
mmetsp:Transcript_36413/g.102861  ORF Transcript_36413/g.102861 Transcript_36413/m.102861 type:complete len:154 (-) Transcript_36413:180-641(-)